MKKIYFIFLFILLLSFIVISGCGNEKISNGEKVTVYKSASCGCCGLYVNELKNRGFNVEVVNMGDLNPIKDRYNIPIYMQSCHTTVMGDYFIEGHVPFEAVKKLLDEKPDISGIALPGMPSGSPGMPGAKNGEFSIFALSKDGSQYEFMNM